jgi:hypothetical protein
MSKGVKIRPTLRGQFSAVADRGLSVRRAHRWLAAHAMVAGVSATAYASHTIQVARTTQADDDTWGLMHLPMQAGFVLALAVRGPASWRDALLSLARPASRATWTSAGSRLVGVGTCLGGTGAPQTA